MIARLAATPSSAAGSSSTAAPWRATATTSSTESGPMPTVTDAATAVGWVGAMVLMPPIPHRARARGNADG